MPLWSIVRRHLSRGGPQPVSRVQREFRVLCERGLLLSLRSLTRTHEVGPVWGVLTSSYLRGHQDVVHWLTDEGHGHVHLADAQNAYHEAESLDDRITLRALERRWPQLVPGQSP